MKYIYFLLLGVMAFEHGTYGTDQLSSEIDIDNHNWAEQVKLTKMIIEKKMITNGKMIIDEEQKLKIWEQKPKNRKQKLTNWRQQINAIQAEIEQSPKKERAQCGRKCIAKTYVQSFFPGLEEAERESKVAEIEQILANKGSEQADHQTFTANVYGNEGFFNQVSGPLRQLIANALEKVLERDRLNLTNDAVVQAFFEKLVIFTGTARRAIAVVADSEGMEIFEIPTAPKFCLIESFSNTFSPAQIRFAQWLVSKNYPESPKDWKTFKRVLYKTSLRGKVTKHGHIFHSLLNMLFIGSDFFKKCMNKAKCLKENPNDPAARAAFTQAMKEFMYTWSQSSTCDRGQAAMLEILVDGMAKYAGCQLKRPEVPEKEKETLRQLTEKFPDRGKIAGTETDTGYVSLTWPYCINGEKLEGEFHKFTRKKDEKFLHDFYYHYDVFALHMSSFKMFDERYKCEFVPIKKQ